VAENFGGGALVEDQLFGGGLRLAALRRERRSGKRREDEGEKQEGNESKSASGHVAIS
jgi:hypothetical protein